MQTPLELIQEERYRQQDEHAFTFEHDDQHSAGELAMAAMCYCLDPIWRPATMAPIGWPWVRNGDMDGFSPNKSRIRELVKAGALIVAEIERLQRLEQFHDLTSHP